MACGGHGGWFVTFADLMGLLMAFFVMLTAFSTQDAKKLQAVAGSMREAFGSQKNPRLAGIVEADGIPTRPHLKKRQECAAGRGIRYTVPDNKNQKDNANQQNAAERKFAAAAASLRQGMMDMPEMAELSKQIMNEETREGLSISLVDQDGRAMFAEGSVQPFERTRRALEAIAGFLKRMPNRIAVTGHTRPPRPVQAQPGPTGIVGRARGIGARDHGACGHPDGRFHAISGKADTDPMFPDNPYFSANRRVTILMMRDEPPLPPSARPEAGSGQQHPSDTYLLLSGAAGGSSPPLRAGSRASNPVTSERRASTCSIASNRSLAAGCQHMGRLHRLMNGEMQVAGDMGCHIDIADEADQFKLHLRVADFLEQGARPGILHHQLVAGGRLGQQVGNQFGIGAARCVNGTRMRVARSVWTRLVTVPDISVEFGMMMVERSAVRISVERTLMRRTVPESVPT